MIKANAGCWAEAQKMFFLHPITIGERGGPEEDENTVAFRIFIYFDFINVRNEESKR